MLTVRPAELRLRRRFQAMPTWAEVAERSFDLAPSEVRTSPPACFDAADLARVVGYIPGTDSSLEYERIAGGVREHGATRVHVLRHAWLLDGHLFTRRAFEELDRRPLGWWGHRPELRLECASLGASRFGLKYFAHWLCEDLPMTLATHALAPAITPQGAAWSNHQQGYLDATGLAIAKPGCVRIDTLYVIDDHGQNAHKRSRLQEVRSRIRARHADAARPGVFLLRGTTGERRRLLNEAELSDSLRHRGFDVFDPATLSADEVMRRCAQASCMVGVEGSHLGHGLVSVADSGALLVIQPPTRFHHLFKDLCDMIDVRYGFTVGSLVDSGPDFRVDVDQVHRLLDRLNVAA